MYVRSQGFAYMLPANTFWLHNKTAKRYLHPNFGYMFVPSFVNGMNKTFNLTIIL
jgi:hypothetical protein